MRSLESALIDHELIVIRVIGEWWELDLTGVDKRQAVKLLAERLMQVDLQQEMLFLPPEEETALQDLLAQDGKIPVSTFQRAYGELRMMGPGRMEREEPWYDPANSVESLWYRGLIFRSFDPKTEDAVEYFYLPNEFLGKIEPPPVLTMKEVTVPAIQPSTPPEQFNPAATDAVDDLTTMLAAALHISLQPGQRDLYAQFLLNPDIERRSLLLTLAQEMGLLSRSNGRIRPTRAALEWLKNSREAQLQSLAEAWTNSEWNDLCHTPDLECEGEGWQNDPLLARTALLDLLPRATEWYRVTDLIDLVQQNNPDFQRPDGNYDTWYIRESGQQLYLTGFDSWNQVEGRLLRFLLVGPLVWLGMVETAVSSETIYRLTSRAVAWLSGATPPTDSHRTPIVVQPDGSILAATSADRYERFQAARISEAQPITPGKPYVYLLTPTSLARAREQGIKPERLQQFLEQASNRPLPKSVARAIVRWAEHSVEGKLETAVVLRVRDAAILDTLRNNPKTRDYISESLADNAAIIKREDWQKFRAATVQLGLLLDVADV
ncbi:MAG: helicase-associated domain-containing protein [Anaerolineales bacterium]|nr:helicase-associated domain-containing protein [Anaerolineales bacterium]